MSRRRPDAAPARAARTTSSAASGPRRPQAGPRGRQPMPMALRRLRALLMLVVVAGGVVYAVHRSHHGAAGSTTKVAAKPVHFSVALTSCSFVDTSRMTHNYSTGTTLPGRHLSVEIRYPTLSPITGYAESPDAHPAYHHGPYPLVLFAPGYDTVPGTYAPLLDTWVRAGFVVASLVFPDTSKTGITAQGGVDTEADDVNQPGDVAFVLRQLAAASATGAGCQVAHHLVNAGKVGLAGQSDGAETVDALEYESDYQVPTVHVLAAESLSGSELYGPSPNHLVAGPPLLVVQSATDSCNPPQFSTGLYSGIPQGDKWFLALKRGNHLPPYTDAADPADFALVAAATTRFFTLEFAHEQPGARFVKLAATPPGVGTITTGHAPALPDLEEASATCYTS